MRQKNLPHSQGVRLIGQLSLRSAEGECSVILSPVNCSAQVAHAIRQPEAVEKGVYSFSPVEFNALFHVFLDVASALISRNLFPSEAAN